MNELSAALRQFADRLEAGELLPGANQCAIVLANASSEVQSVFMGAASVPADKAGVQLLAAGIMRFNQGDTIGAPVPVRSILSQSEQATGSSVALRAAIEAGPRPIFEDHA